MEDQKDDGVLYKGRWLLEAFKAASMSVREAETSDAPFFSSIPPPPGASAKNGKESYMMVHGSRQAAILNSGATKWLA